MKKRSRTLTSLAAGMTLAGALAVTAGSAAQAAPPYQAGPFSSLSSCNSTRTTYVHDGGFSYVGSCYRQTNGKYYFQYQ